MTFLTKLWRVLQSFTQWRPQAEVEGVQIWWLWGVKCLWAKNSRIVVQPLLHSLCRVYWPSVLLEKAIWFLCYLLNPWKNFRLQIFLNVRGYMYPRSNQSGGIFSTFDATTPRAESTTAWLLTQHIQTSFANVTTRSIILFVEDMINGENFLIEKNEDFIPVNFQVIRQTGVPLQALLNNCCINRAFLERQTVFINLSNHLGHSGDKNFLFLCQSCHFLAWVVVEGFFADLLA